MFGLEKILPTRGFLLAAFLNAGALAIPAYEAQAQDSYISAPGYSRTQTIPALSSQDHACKGDFKCGVRTIERARSLTRHPHFFSVFHAALGLGPQAGRIMVEGYENTMRSNAAVSLITNVAPFLPPKRGMHYFNAGSSVAGRIAGDADDLRVDFNVLGLDAPEDLQKEAAFEHHLVYGRSNAEQRIYLARRSGRDNLDRVSYFTQRLHEVTIAKNPASTDAQALKKSFRQEFGFGVNDADALIQLYRDALDKLEGGVELASDMTMADRLSDQFSKSLKPVLRLEEEMRKLREQLEEGQGRTEELEQQLNDLQKEREEAAQKLFDENIAKTNHDIGSVEASTGSATRSATEMLAEARRNPVYVGGRLMYSQSLRFELQGIAASTEFFGAVLQVAGVKGADRFVASVNYALQLADAGQALSELDFKRINSAADMTALMNSATSIVGAISFFFNLMGGDEENPMQQVFEQLFDVLGQVLENQQKILQGIEELIQGQLSMKYHLGAISESLDALKQGQTEQARLVLRRFDRIEARMDFNYLDTQRRLDIIADQLKLQDLFGALGDEDNRGALDVFGVPDEEERRKQLRVLASGMTDIQDALRRDPYLETGGMPASGYTNSLVAGNNGQGHDGGQEADILMRRGFSGRRKQLQKILEPLCAPTSTCSIFDNVPNGNRLRGLTLLYMRGAEILVTHETGRKFLTRDEDRTVAMLGQEITELQNLGAYAREALPEARAIYKVELERAHNLLQSYIHEASVAVAGEANATQWESENRLWLDGQTLVESIDQLGDDQMFDLAAHHGIGVYGHKPSSRTDNQRFQMNPSWSIMHYLTVQSPLWLNRPRAEYLLKDVQGGRALIQKIASAGFVPLLLGGKGISSTKYAWNQRLGQDLTGVPCVFDAQNLFCVYEVVSGWLTGNPVTIATTRQHADHLIQTVRARGKLFDFINNNPEHIKQNIPLEDARQLSQTAVKVAVLETRDAALREWERAGQGFTPDFSNIPAVQPRPEIFQILEQVRSTMQRLADARLIYDTALRLGYGADCIGYADELRLEVDLLEGGVFFEQSDYGTLPPGGSLSAQQPKTAQQLKLDQTIKALQDMEASSPYDIAALSEVCMVGHAGAEQLAELHQAYIDWVEKGTQPANEPNR